MYILYIYIDITFNYIKKLSNSNHEVVYGSHD